MINFIKWMARNYLGVEDELQRLEVKISNLEKQSDCTFQQYALKNKERFEQICTLQEKIQELEKKCEEWYDRHRRFVESCSTKHNQDIDFLIQVADPKTMRRILGLNPDEAATLIGMTEVELLRYEGDEYPPEAVHEMMYRGYKKQYEAQS